MLQKRAFRVCIKRMLKESHTAFCKCNWITSNQSNSECVLLRDWDPIEFLSHCYLLWHCNSAFELTAEGVTHPRSCMGGGLLATSAGTTKSKFDTPDKPEIRLQWLSKLRRGVKTNRTGRGIRNLWVCYRVDRTFGCESKIISGIWDLISNKSYMKLNGFENGFNVVTSQKRDTVKSNFITFSATIKRFV